MSDEYVLLCIMRLRLAAILRRIRRLRVRLPLAVVCLSSPRSHSVCLASYSERDEDDDHDDKVGKHDENDSTDVHDNDDVHNEDDDD